MKTLCLIRHAKSSWNIEGLEDMDRHLNHRGYTDAHVMAKRIAPDLKEPKIISSPAIRALSTALIFARTFEIDPATIVMEKELYESSVRDYLKVIHSRSNNEHTIMLFGHNPIISGVLDYFTASTSADIPTCAVAVIQLNIDEWSAAAPQHAKLVKYDFPKNK